MRDRAVDKKIYGCHGVPCLLLSAAFCCFLLLMAAGAVWAAGCARRVQPETTIPPKTFAGLHVEPAAIRLGEGDTVVTLSTGMGDGTGDPQGGEPHAPS